MKQLELRIRIGKNENVILPCFEDENGIIISRHFGIIQPSTIIENLETDKDSWNSLNGLYDEVLTQRHHEYIYETPLDPNKDKFEKGSYYWVHRALGLSCKKLLQVCVYHGNGFYDDEYKIPNNEILGIFNIYTPKCDIDTENFVYDFVVGDEVLEDSFEHNIETIGINPEFIGN